MAETDDITETKELTTESPIEAFVKIPLVKTKGRDFEADLLTARKIHQNIHEWMGYTCHEREKRKDRLYHVTDLDEFYEQIDALAEMSSRDVEIKMLVYHVDSRTVTTRG